MFYVAKSVFVSLIAALMISECCSLASAQTDQVDAKSDAEQAIVEKWKEIYDELIDSISLTHRSKNNDSTLTTDGSGLKRQTLLSFKGDFLASARHGKVYLWTDKGRPIIIGAAFSGKVDTPPGAPGARSLGIKFNSLVAGSVIGSRFDNVFWQCDDPGPKWKEELSDVVPSDNRTTRLSHMKSIVRQFTGNRNTSQLRLLPQPIYRYPENTAGAKDGAIFSLSTGTEPGAYIQIESRENLWYLTCYRDGAVEVEIRNGDEIVWLFDKVAKQDLYQTEPFYFKYTTDRRVADDPSKILFSNWGKR